MRLGPGPLESSELSESVPHKLISKFRLRSVSLIGNLPLKSPF